MSTRLKTGVIHRVPKDLREALLESQEATNTWNDLTPLARNEWICWVTFVKQVKTREEHVKRAIEDLRTGKRRPCCWPGCPHREKNGR